MALSLSVFYLASHPRRMQRRMYVPFHHTVHPLPL